MRQVGQFDEGDFFQLPWGRFIWRNNEWHLEADPGKNDPPGSSYIGANGCKISWKDAAGREKALLQMRQNAKGDGEFYLGCLSEKRYSEEVAKRNPNALDAAMIEVMVINPDEVEFRVPVKMSASSVPSGSSQSFMTADGRYLLIEQADGNTVVYDRGNPVWDRWSHEATAR